MNLNKKKILNNKLLITLLVLFISVSCEKNHYNFAGVIKDGKYCNTNSDCNDSNDPLAIKMVCDGPKHRCIEDPCKDVSCGEGAKECSEDREDPTKYECICKDDYKHPSETNKLVCIPIEPCKNITCSGKGSCKENGDTLYCECNKGFKPKGLECISVCDNITCSGKGSCKIDEDNKPSCDCDNHFTAKGLECIEDPCSEISCVPDISTCKSEPKDGRLVPYCECSKDGGCGTDDNLCPPDRCNINGHCSIYLDRSRATCDCDDGFINVGFNCVDENPCSDTSLCGVDESHGECSVEDYKAICSCKDNYLEIDKRCVPEETLLSHIFGSKGNETINDIVIDRNNNIILVGSFNLSDEGEDKLQFTNSNFLTICDNCSYNAQKDIFILKIGKDGINSSNSWIKTFGSVGDDEAVAVTIDNQNNIIIGGYYSGEMIISTGDQEVERFTLPEEDAKKSFILGLDNNGEFLYKKEIEKETEGEYYIISDIIFYNNPINHNNYIITSTNDTNSGKIFSFLLNSNVLTDDWSTTLSSKDDYSIIGKTKVNNIVLIKDIDGKDKFLGITGYFCKNADSGCYINTDDICTDGSTSIDCDGPFHTVGNSDIYFMKVNLSNGKIDNTNGYIKIWGSNGADEGVDIKSYYIDNDENKGSYLYLAGTFSDTLSMDNSFDFGVNISTFLRNFKDSKDNDNGQTIAMSGFISNQIAIDNDNNIFLAGYDIVDDDRNTALVYRVNHYLDNNQEDIRLLSFFSNDTSNNRVKSIAIDKNGYKYIAGEFTEQISLPGSEGYPHQNMNTRASLGENDIFFMKYSSDYPPE